jgi:hypothetical protein
MHPKEVKLKSWASAGPVQTPKLMVTRQIHQHTLNHRLIRIRRKSPNNQRQACSPYGCRRVDTCEIILSVLAESSGVTQKSWWGVAER